MAASDRGLRELVHALDELHGLLQATSPDTNQTHEKIIALLNIDHTTKFQDLTNALNSAQSNLDNHSGALKTAIEALLPPQAPHSFLKNAYEELKNHGPTPKCMWVLVIGAVLTTVVQGVVVIALDFPLIGSCLVLLTGLIYYHYLCRHFTMDMLLGSINRFDGEIIAKLDGNGSNRINASIVATKGAWVMHLVMIASMLMTVWMLVPIAASKKSLFARKEVNAPSEPPPVQFNTAGRMEHFETIPWPREQTADLDSTLRSRLDMLLSRPGLVRIYLVGGGTANSGSGPLTTDGWIGMQRAVNLGLCIKEAMKLDDARTALLVPLNGGEGHSGPYVEPALRTANGHVAIYSQWQ